MTYSSQFLVNTSTNLEITVYVDGTATDADADTVTLGVVDEAGNTVVSAGTAYTSKNGTGVYRYLLTPQTQVKKLTATWAVTVNAVVQTLVTSHEVVGGFLFTESEARNFDALADETAGLATAAEYTDAQIAEARAQITDQLEDWTGVSWVPRYHRETLPGTGTALIYPSKRQIGTIIEATDGSTDISSSLTVLSNDCGIRRTSGVFSAPTNSDPENITLGYRHGYESLRDGVKHIALVLAYERLVPKTIPRNALSWDFGLGSQRFVQPGGPAMNLTAVPEVNQWLLDHRLQTNVA